MLPTLQTTVSLTLAFCCVTVQGSTVSAGLLLLSHPGFHQLCRVLWAAHPASPRGWGVQGLLRPVPIQSWCLSWGHKGLLRARQPQQSHQGTACTQCWAQNAACEKLVSLKCQLFSSSTKTNCIVLWGPERVWLQVFHHCFTLLCSLHPLHTFHHWELLFSRSALTNAYGP